MTERFVNNVTTTLAAPMTSMSGTVTVTSATGLPSTGNFRLLIDSGTSLEYVLVTGVAGSVLTVTRGIEGTVAVPHASGVQAVQVLTAGGLQQTIVEHASTAPSGTGVALVLSGAFVSAAGTVDLSSSTYVSGDLPVANIAGGSSGQVLQMSGATVAWGAAPTTGITQLTGDVTAGAGTGSQAAVVAAVHGATVPAAGALTTGNVLQVTGISALGYGAINLGGGAGYVSGTLPVGNLPSLAGDVTGALNVNHVGTLAGPAGSGGQINVGDGTNQLTFKGVTSLQTTPPNTVCVGSQGFGSAATAGVGGRWYVYGGMGGTATSGVVTGGKGGGVSVIAGQGGNGFGASATAGGGGDIAIFSGSPGSPGAGGASGASGVVSLGIGSTTALAIGATGFLTASSLTAGLVHSTSTGLLGTVLGTAGQLPVTNAGGTDVAFVSLSGDVASVTGPGAVTLQGAQYGQTAARTWDATTGLETIATGATAPGLTQTIAASGFTPRNLVLTPQAPYAYSSGSPTAAQQTPGSVVVSLPALSAYGGTPGVNSFFQINYGGVPCVCLGGASPIGATTAYPSLYSGLYFGPNISPTSTNYSLMTDNSVLYINVPTASGFYRFGYAGTNPCFGVSAYGIQLSTVLSTPTFDLGGGAVNILGISKCTTNPSAAPAGSLIWTDSSTADLCLLTAGYKTPAIRIGALGGSGNIAHGLPLAGSAMGTTGGVLNAPLQFQNTAIAISNGVDFSPTTAAHYQSPVWILSGSLTSGNTNLNLPSLLGIWFIDTSAITFSGGASLTIKNGTATHALSSHPSGDLVVVIVDGSNALRFVHGTTS